MVFQAAGELVRLLVPAWLVEILKSMLAFLDVQIARPVIHYLLEAAGESIGLAG